MFPPKIPSKFSFAIFLIHIFLFHSFASAQTIPFDTTGYITGRDVRLRKEPTLNGEVIGLMEIGTHVTIKQKTVKQTTVGSHKDYWYEVELKPLYEEEGKVESVSGWAFGQFLKMDFPSFDFKNYFDSLNHSSFSVPDLYKKILKYRWSSCDWSEYNEYGSEWGTINFAPHVVYQLGQYDEGWAYEITKISAPTSNTLEFESRFSGFFITSEEGQRIIYSSVPFPSRQISFKIIVYDNFDSIRVDGFKNMRVDGEDSSFTLYNKSSPACFRVIADSAELRRPNYYFTDPRHVFQLDSLNGFAKKDQIFYNVNQWGFLSYKKETISGKSDYWYNLSSSNTYARDFIFGGNLVPATLGDVNADLSGKFLSHPDQEPFSAKSFYQDTPQGRRRLAVNPGFIVISEPDKTIRILVFNSNEEKGRVENGLLEFRNWGNLLFTMELDPGRKGQWYTHANLQEQLYFDLEKKCFISRYGYFPDRLIMSGKITDVPWK